MIFVLFTVLLLLLIIIYTSEKKDIISPSFVFCLSFLFSSIWCIVFYKEWSMELFHANTAILIISGVCIFAITSFITRKLYLIFKKVDMNNESVHEIKIDIFIKVLSLLLILFSAYMCLRDVLRITGYSWGNIFKAISRYDYLSKFSSQSVGFSKITTISRYISHSLTYWYLYVLVNNILATKKIDFLNLSIVIMGMASSMTSGGRNSAINMLLSIPAVLFVLSNRTNRARKKLSFKTKLTIVLIPLTALMIFPKLTNFVGREVSTTNTYYLGIYCGAEIKNLDLYLQEYKYEINPDKKNMTFRNLILWIGPALYNVEPYGYDLPFRSVNNNNLGNVYTTFYAFLYDYGYIGVVVLVALMAFILQFVYEKCKRAIIGNKPNIWILVYGYMFSAIALSFFSNKFYEQNFNATFVYSIVLWIIYNKVFISMKFKHKK